MVAEHNAKVKRGKSNNNNTGGAAKSESNTDHAAQVSNEVKGFDERVNITFIVYRHKLIDPDNNYSKHVTDTIVKSGILRNDTSNEIEEVRYRQVKIPEWEQEKTEMIIEVANARR